MAKQTIATHAAMPNGEGSMSFVGFIGKRYDMPQIHQPTRKPHSSGNAALSSSSGIEQLIVTPSRN